ncbi:stage III sporulation protein AA [Radiobacillus sp. PE A8.2]|uniref:stage III sporulation protein AA n=1 Tax=Radiobacillus sp. PE A8.2 TaxID=3380349 RepID=UPI00388F6151
MQEIIRLFPKTIKEELVKRIANRWPTLQEIRIRIGRPVELIFDQREEWLKSVIPSTEDGMHILNQLSQFSLYRMEDELREGFITIEGGHRVGLAGRVNTIDGNVKAIKHIASFNIRIAKQKIGAASAYIRHLYDGNYHNTLIIGPPQTGKTTLLRDVARFISTGWGQVRPYKIGVIDERSEIAGSVNGIPQHELGPRSDVMDACPKAEGMMMMIRSMSPEVIIVDEIGSGKDVQALMEAIHAGVRIVCSIHGQSFADLRDRPSLQPLFKQHAFDRYLILSRGTKPGMVETILDREGNHILKKPRCTEDEMDRGTSSAQRYHMGRF